jgi:hypothetical protein
MNNIETIRIITGPELGSVDARGDLLTTPVLTGLLFVPCCWLCLSGSLADGRDSRWQRVKTSMALS